MEWRDLSSIHPSVIPAMDMRKQEYSYGCSTAPANVWGTGWFSSLYQEQEENFNSRVGIYFSSAQ